MAVTCELDYIISDRTQLYHVLETELIRLGGGRLYITTFGISEEFVRKIAKWKADGLLSSIDIAIDYRALQKSSRIQDYILQTVDRFSACNNHSKIMLIEGQKGVVSIVSSQNLSRGNRTEIHILIKSEKIFFDLKRDFNNIRSNRNMENSENNGNTENTNLIVFPGGSIEEQIHEYAMCLMSIDDISALCGIDKQTLLEAIEINNTIGKAYKTGKAKTQYALHKQEIQYAIGGSPSGIEAVKGYLEDMNTSEI